MAYTDTRDSLALEIGQSERLPVGDLARCEARFPGPAHVAVCSFKDAYHQFALVALVECLEDDCLGPLVAVEIANE